MTISLKSATKSSCVYNVSDLLVTRSGRSARVNFREFIAKPVLARLNDGILTWVWSRKLTSHFPTTAEVQAPQRVPVNLWQQFVCLTNGSDEDIRKFAARWGPLSGKIGQTESISVWREYSEVAGAIIRMAARAEDFEPDESKANADSAILVKWISGSSASQVRTSVRLIQRQLVAAAINLWFDNCAHYGLIDIVRGQLQIRPRAASLKGQLITQIAHVVTRNNELFVCAGCGRAFRLTRQPSTGKRRYCSACRKRGVPERDAARDYRRRKKQVVAT